MHLRRCGGIYLSLLMFGLALPTECGWAQARVFDSGQEPRDRSYELPWRDLQSGGVSVRNVRDPCVGAGIVAEQDAAPPASPSVILPQMINGAKASPCIFRDLVRIDFVDTWDEPAHCTGVLIAPNLVLTAAHCTCGILDSYIIRQHSERRPPTADENNRNGDDYILARAPDRFQKFSCEVSPELQPGRDLSVLTIEKRNRAATRITDVLKPNQDSNPFVGLSVATTGQIFGDRAETKILVGAGYGETEDEDSPDEPRFAALPIASLFCAEGRFADSFCSTFREFVLADGPLHSSDLPSDSCAGDSGAPIFYMPPDTLSDPDRPSPVGFVKAITLVGITSRALRGVDHLTTSLCGGGGIYTAVGHPDVVAWLRTFGIDVFNVFDVGKGAEQ